jgi:probable F420-dependent oxidoreductase
MKNGLTFALSVPQFIAVRPDGSFDADAYATVVAEADRLGYDQILVADHVFVPSYWAKVIGDFFLDPFVLLSHLAARTTSIELVLACLVMPYRQPFTTAKMVASLDQVSNGRMALGVVPGYLKEEFEAFNLPIDERAAMTDEFLELMKELWTSEAATFEGRYYSADGIDLKPRCARSPHVPIWVGGSWKGALRRVAHSGDVWHPLGWSVVDDTYREANAQELAGKVLPTSGTTPEKLAAGVEEIRRMADEAGRDIGHLQVVPYCGLPEDETTRGLPLTERGAMAIIGGGPKVVDWLGRYLDAGATGFVVTTGGMTPAECIEQLHRFAEETAPELEARAN